MIHDDYDNSENLSYEQWVKEYNEEEKKFRRED